MRNVEMSLKAAEAAGVEQSPRKAMGALGAVWCSDTYDNDRDTWTFWGCKGLPKVLPVYMSDVSGATEDPTEAVDHPSHYGGEDNPYEAIKVIEAWGLGFNLGNTVKYIARTGKKDDALQDLKKALWYLEREIKTMEGK